MRIASASANRLPHAHVTLTADEGTKRTGSNTRHLSQLLLCEVMVG